MPLTTTYYHSELKTGIYRHYKGKNYKVFGTVTHSETEECMVLYAPLGQEAGQALLWVRPLAMFTEDVTVKGKTMPRFRHLDGELLAACS